MAYTYDDFINAAKNAGMYEAFSQDDLVTAQSSPEYGLSLLKLQQDAAKATTEEQKLLVQEAVNQLRSTYGQLKTGTAGTASSAPAADATGTAGSFAYSGATDYQKLLDKVSTPGSFDYDHRKDPTYGAIKSSWISDGDRTSGKLLGSQTVPQSSWAKSAAQQSNNYYDAKLTDQIPTIYQDAFEEYLHDQNNELSKLGAVNTDKSFDYAAYLQQQQLDQAAAQQKFTNDMTLHQQFGTAAPTMPDLDNLTPGTDTAYTYGKDTEHQKALDAVINQDPFAYEHLTDPLYGSLRKTSLREGDRVAADTLAEISARTGGTASSYGIRAAADAGNAYNEQLNSQIPGLRKTAYQEYLGDFEGKLQGLAALEEDRAFDYQKWLQEYQLKEAAKQQEFENALALYKEVGLTPEIAAILGVPYVAPRSGGGGSGSGSGKKIDYNSVLNLGYGPISGSTLGSLVSSGAVKETTNGNTVSFSPNTSSSKPKTTLSSLSVKNKVNGY